MSALSGRSLAGWTLRTKLVAALLALAAVGLSALGVASVLALHDYLLKGVENQLAATARMSRNRVLGPPTEGRRDGPPQFNRPAQATAFYVLLSNADGTVPATRPDGRDNPDFHQPDRGNLTASVPDLPKLDAVAVQRLKDKPFTASARAGGPDWRVLIVPLDGGSGSIAVGVTLNEVDATTQRLALVELPVFLAVLLVLALLGHVVVRSSLRRLVEVEVTAEAIAAGDLSRRVPESDPRTEVGRLAAAFNAMLTQIESAFRARESSEASARASEERMRRFVADASHELRTPLTSIRGFAELHRQGAVPDAAGVARVIRRIEDEAARMSLLVEDLLLLARLDQQRPLDRKPVDLLAIATDAAGDAEVVAPDHPVRLEIDRTPGAPPPVVTGDEARLRQVVSNLVSNALRHTPPGTSVTIRLATDDQRARLSVADTGPGLAPEHAERVFERFYRADPSRARVYGGSGLGLSIVASLVAAHGGTVRVTSTPGAGARFDVELPLHGSPARTDTAVAH